MVINHEFYMNLALQEAWKYQGVTYPNPAVGSLLLDPQGQIIAIDAHKKAGLPHAEVETLKAGFLKLCHNKTLTDKLQVLTESKEIHDFLSIHHDHLFEGCTLYVTLEPCNHFGKTPPCSLLIKKVGIEKVIIGSMDPNKEATGGKAELETAGITVETGICQAECDRLIEPFILWQHKQFVFFKHAQTLNGTIDGGYISGETSLKHVHALRDKIGLLVIGGNTVRNDRPTLDTRFVGGKAPDILIYTHEKEIDRTIPLFGVKGREVFVSNSLEKISEYNYVMIEGGERMYAAVESLIDWHLLYLAPIMRKGLNFSTEKRGKILYRSQSGEDILIWMDNKED